MPELLKINFFYLETKAQRLHLLLYYIFSPSFSVPRPFLHKRLQRTKNILQRMPLNKIDPRIETMWLLQALFRLNDRLNYLIMNSPFLYKSNHQIVILSREVFQLIFYLNIYLLWDCQRDKPQYGLNDNCYFTSVSIVIVADYIYMDWCKGNCYPTDSGEGYLVKKSNQDSKFYNRVGDIEKILLEDQNVSIVKLQKSNYDQLNKQSIKSNRKFTDSTFVPSQLILGKLDEMTTSVWKRLSELKEPYSVFNTTTNPFQATRYSAGTKAFHAALAAVAEDQEKLDKIFDKQIYNENGVYKLLLKNKSKIEEIIIDDFMPFSAQGKYALSIPLKKQIWVLLLEKAMAKVYGSYEKMYRQLSAPKEVFQCLLYSPGLKIEANQMPNQSQQIWKRISQNKAPIVLYTSNNADSGKHLYLNPQNYYTILGGAQLIDINGVSQKIVKLRDAFKNEEFRGDLTLDDNKLWQSITNQAQKHRLLQTKNDKNGIFFLKYKKFLQIFQTLYFSQYEKTYSYISEQLKPTLKNGLLYEIQSTKDIVYNFIIEQYDLAPIDKSQTYQDDGYCRTTLLLILIDPKEKDNQYKLLSGTLRYNQKQIVLSHLLPRGKYLLYVKVQPTVNKQNYPKIMNFSIYSQFLLKIQLKKQTAHPDFIKNILLNDSKENKKQVYEQGKMWASWNIIGGGYAYIALVNKKDSGFKFIVRLDEELINSRNFTLKKPFKGKKYPEFQVLPGAKQIILLRVKNSNVKEISFPIPIELHMSPIKETQQ